MKDLENNKIDLMPVDRVEILVLMDSMADYLLPATQNIVRPSLTTEGHIHRIPLLAEHGLSLLIRIIQNKSCQTILLDTGWSGIGLKHNIKYLGVDTDTIDTIVLSHGHIDHSGGLLEVLDRISHPIPVVIHPDAFLSVRFLNWEERVNLIQLDRQDVIDKGGQLVESVAPYLSPNSFWATTGQVPRVSEFEKGLSNAYLERSGERERDDILDDQSIVILVKDKGLIVISGCAHSGIINTVRQCQKITDIEDVYAIVGGFHLAGGIEESVQDKTIAALEDIRPEIIIPMHCTGFASIAKIRQRLPRNTHLSSVGTEFLLPFP